MTDLARLALAGLALLVGCDPPLLTEIVIETETDYAIGSEITRIDWEIRGTETAPVEPFPSVELRAEDEDLFPLTLTALPARDPNSPLHVIARGYGPDGALLVAAARRTRFTAGVSSVLHIALSRLCADVPCALGETCAPMGSSGDCTDEVIGADLLPGFRAGRSNGPGELCNGRDDDGDGADDNGFEVGADPLHCQACFDRCPGLDDSAGGPTCERESCGYACAPLRGDCNEDIDDGCETRLTEQESCGACGVACAEPTPLCVERGGVASCESSCPDGQAECDGACVDTSSSEAHCGGCGDACAPTGPLGQTRCEAGECRPTCDEGSQLCSGTCVPEDSALACGVACERCPTTGDGVTDGICREGACRLVCEAGRFDCDARPGCETVSEGDDPQNCGGCGIDCGSGTCDAGVCSTAVVSFELGPRHSCARLRDGTVWCWGANESAQLGTGAVGGLEQSPVRSAAIGAAAAITALDDRSTYFYVGAPGSIDPEDGYHVIGVDPTLAGSDPNVADTVTLAPMRLYDTAGIVSVGGGTLLATAVEKVGWFLVGLGDTAHAAFGGLATAADRFVDFTGLGPIDWSGFIQPRAARGDRVSCAELTPGALSCWGLGDSVNPAYTGHAGGDERGAATPQTVRVQNSPYTGGRSSLAYGFASGCASFQESFGTGASRYHCWGRWGHTSCGVPRVMLEPEAVDGPNSADALTSLSVGDGVACAVSVLTGQLVCWGRDLRGGCPNTQVDPFVGTAFEDLRDVSAVRVSRDHGCFLRQVGGTGGSGTLYCWGDDTHGQLGNGAANGGEPRQVVFGSAASL